MDWVMGLCPSDLWYWHERLVSQRTDRLREQLHVLVSASAVTVDGGEAFKAMDQSLAPKAAAPAAKEKVPAEALSQKAVAYADEAAAVAAMMWED